MKSKGFTLIELLVVVAIIGILATVVLASLGSARDKARDQAMRSHFAQLRSALELYYMDNNSYPVTSSWCIAGHTSTPTCNQASGSNGWIPNLAPNYIPALRMDRGTTADSTWYYMGGVGGYKVMLHQPNNILSAPVTASDPMRDDNVGGARTWALSMCVNLSQNYCGF